LLLFFLSTALGGGGNHPKDIKFGKITFWLKLSKRFASTYNELNATASLENKKLSVSPKSSIRILLLLFQPLSSSTIFTTPSRWCNAVSVVVVVVVVVENAHSSFNNSRTIFESSSVSKGVPSSLLLLLLLLLLTVVVSVVSPIDRVVVVVVVDDDDENEETRVVEE
jgi:hypothetical protein